MNLIFPRLEQEIDEENKEFVLSLSCIGVTHIFKIQQLEDHQSWFNTLKLKAQVLLRHMSRNYEIGKLIGEGSIASVHVGKNRRTGKEYAIKSIKKGKIKERPKIIVNK